MRRRVHTHIVLFFAAVLLLSLVLTAVGIRLLSQEDELLTARLLERRRVAAQDLSLQLAERLDAPDPSVVVATLTWQRNRISLPWEVDLDHSRAELATASFEFRQELRRGEALEFTESDYVAALVGARERDVLRSLEDGSNSAWDNQKGDSMARYMCTFTSRGENRNEVIRRFT